MCLGAGVCVGRLGCVTLSYFGRVAPSANSFGDWWEIGKWEIHRECLSSFISYPIQRSLCVYDCATHMQQHIGKAASILGSLAYTVKLMYIYSMNK